MSIVNSRKRRYALLSAAATAAVVAAAAISTTAQADDLDWQVADLTTADDNPSVMGADGSAADDIWAVGSYHPADGGSGMSHHWDGSEWTEVTVPGNTELRDVASFGEDDAWAVGGGADGAAALRWDGAEWTPVDTPTEGEALDRVAGVASDDLWAVGHEVQFEDSYVEHWNGEQWTAVDLPVPEDADTFQLTDITPAATDDVWAVGNVNGSDPLVMHWDGDQWTRSETEGLNGGKLAASTVVDGTLWAISDHDMTNQLSYYDGEVWATVDSDAEYMTVSGLVPDGQGGVRGAGYYTGESGKLLHYDGEKVEVGDSPKEDDAYLSAITYIEDDDVTSVLGAWVDDEDEVPYAAVTA